MKRPAFQFYPGDWQRDTALRSCSIGSRGLWFEMLCIMHDGSPYGHLRVGEKDLTPEQLARMVGGSQGNVKRWLKELEAAEVFSRTQGGTIFSRRMVRDEEIRQKRAAGGIKSIEHPNTLKPKTLQGRVPFMLPFDLPPSSASSSSSSSATTKEIPCFPLPDRLSPTDIQNRWNQIPGVKPCKALGDTILKHLKTSLAEHPDLAWWGSLFAQVGQSDWLCGRTNGTRETFHATLDWVLRSKNLDKILAGNYDNSSNGAGSGNIHRRVTRDVTEVLEELEQGRYSADVCTRAVGAPQGVPQG